jgi:DNA-binding transcriptional LysR family regulator
MDVRRLRYFAAVADTLHFTRAAERLHIAQPPLSAQIRALEEELGTPLFVRDRRRGVALTQAGRVLQVHAHAILQSVDDAGHAARRAGAGATGRLALAYTASAMFTERLPAAIRRFRVAHPGIDLALHEMPSVEQLDALDAHRLDVGILRRPEVPTPAGVAIEPWYRAPLIAAVPQEHPLARRRSLAIADLRDEPLVTYPRDAGIGLYWPILHLCARAGFRPRIAREALEPSVMMGLVSAGIGIAIVPADTRCIGLGGVVYQPIRDPGAESTLHLAHRSGDPDRHAGLLLAALRAEAKRPAAQTRRAAGDAAARKAPARGVRPSGS